MIRWTHFPLHPDTPPQGRSLEDLFGVSSERVEAIQEDMRARMADEGLPYGARSMTYNSRLAQELGAWAESMDPVTGQRTHDAFFAAYFVDARNLSDREVLMDVVASVGLDVGEATLVLDERRVGDAVDRDWERSRTLGVTGVPTFVMGGQGVVGAQPYSLLDSFVREMKER